MGYYIDLASISIDTYRTKLESGYLPPSRLILKDRTEERFGYFMRLGIKNVRELLQLLKKKDNFRELLKEDCFSAAYLTILLRELNSMLPKPNRIKDFAGISEDVILKLEKLGIKDTFRLFNSVKSPEGRKELAEQTGIGDADILELTKLTDLSRIKWTGATFARMLYDAGFDTVDKAARADCNDLHLRINQINKERSYFKGQIGLNDIKIFIDAAKEVPLEIEYPDKVKS
ncbi:MAG: DUF4332 domain-containing protein [Lentimicrobium sp.]